MHGVGLGVSRGQCSTYVQVAAAEAATGHLLAQLLPASEEAAVQADAPAALPDEGPGQGIFTVENEAGPQAVPAPAAAPVRPLFNCSSRCILRQLARRTEQEWLIPPADA